MKGVPYCVDTIGLQLGLVWVPCQRDVVLELAETFQLCQVSLFPITIAR